MDEHKSRFFKVSTSDSTQTRNESLRISFEAGNLFYLSDDLLLSDDEIWNESFSS